MVSKESVIQTNSKCICGKGDVENHQPNYFQNTCANCGEEGKLQVETLDNVEQPKNNEENNNTTQSEGVPDNTSPSVKIVCKNCGSEFCGQDGYDLLGGTRGSLTTVNPNEITDEDESEVSSTEEGETTYMSGWEGLCDLLKPLDGQAMMVQRGDFVVIKKIEMPQIAKLWAYEGINVVDDSVSITDYTPEIYNTFIIKWGESFENELEFTFNKHKQLFGERKTVIEAKKYSVVEDDENKSSDDSESSDSKSDSSKSDSEKSDSGISNSIFGSSNMEENVSSSNVPTDTTGDLGVADESGTGESENAPKTEQIPIIDREEAIQFGLTQVGKAKRDDGHTIELKVIGNTNWQMGEWCHVKLPSFNEDSYMFISKCGLESSPDGEYINSLTLVDYPPSLGKPGKVEQEGEEEKEETDGSDSSSDSNDDSSSNENSDNSSDNSSDNNTNSDSSTGNNTNNN